MNEISYQDIVIGDVLLLIVDRGPPLLVLALSKFVKGLVEEFVGTVLELNFRNKGFINHDYPIWPPEKVYRLN